MTRDHNKIVIRQFFAALAAGDLDRIDQLTTGDFTWWVAPTTTSSGTYGKEAWLQLVSGILADLGGPMGLQFGDFTAEDDRVSVTLVGHMLQKSGKIYNSHYHNLFWLRDGKISAVKEYLDTYHAGEIFGFPNAAA